MAQRALPPQLAYLRDDKRLLRETLAAFGVKASSHPRLTNAPVYEIPYRRDGEAYASKWLPIGSRRGVSTPGVSRDVFNSDVLDRPALAGVPITLAQHELEVMALTQWGMRRVICPPEPVTGNFTERERKMVARLAARLNAAKSPIVVTTALDKGPSIHLTHALLGLCPDLEILMLPWTRDGDDLCRDANEVLFSLGPKALGQRVRTLVFPKLEDPVARAWHDREAEARALDTCIAPLSFEPDENPFDRAQGDGWVNVTLPTSPQTRRLQVSADAEGRISTYGRTYFLGRHLADGLVCDAHLHFGRDGTEQVFLQHPISGPGRWCSTREVTLAWTDDKSVFLPASIVHH